MMGPRMESVMLTRPILDPGEFVQYLLTDAHQGQSGRYPRRCLKGVLDFHEAFKVATRITAGIIIIHVLGTSYMFFYLSPVPRLQDRLLHFPER